jgi:hypothetical protein
MSKDAYKREINSLVNQLIKSGANRDQVLNALTETALDHIKVALDENKEKLQQQESNPGT